MKKTGLQLPKRLSTRPCHLCHTPATSLRPFHPATFSTFRSLTHLDKPALTRPSPSRARKLERTLSLCANATRLASTQAAPAQSQPHASDGSPTVQDVKTMLKALEQDYRKLVTSLHVPTEAVVVDWFKKCQEVVRVAMSVKPTDAAQAPSSSSTGNTSPQKAATSSLLDLDNGEDKRGLNGSRRGPQYAVPRPPGYLPAQRPAMQAIGAIPSLMHSLLRDSKVFISEEVLRLYTEIQCTLGEADHIPEIFNLFATKPIPLENSKVEQPQQSQHAQQHEQQQQQQKQQDKKKARRPGSVSYTRNSPSSAKSAIPTDLANKALDTAIKQHNLSLALAIIDTTFRTTAFKRAKLIRHAGVPALLALSAPPGAWVAGKWASTFTVAMEPSTATWVSFSAIMAYLTFTGAIGFVAIATANDQMERVVWMPGTPLRERWVREEERAALDRIACAWGFKDPVRRGEEEGEEWEALREIIGLRGMILDKTDLMDGME